MMALRHRLSSCSIITTTITSIRIVVIIMFSIHHTKNVVAASSRLFHSSFVPVGSRRNIVNTNRIHQQRAAFTGTCTTSRRKKTNTSPYQTVQYFNQHHNHPPVSSFSTTTSLLESSKIETDLKDDVDVDRMMENDDFFANIDFHTLGVQSPILIERLKRHFQITRPTTIQAESFQAIRSQMTSDVDNVDNSSSSKSSNSILVGAETGTGKTLAYLLPIMDDIIQRKEQQKKKGNNQQKYLGYEYGRVLILVPNKELIQQVVRMATLLAGGSRSVIYPPNGYRITSSDIERNNTEKMMYNDTPNVRIAVMPGGLREVDTDFVPFRNRIVKKEQPIDIIISTPAAIGPLALSMKNLNMFLDIDTLIVDEADMLLDGGYLRPLQDVFLGFRRADKIVKRNVLSYDPNSETYTKWSNDETNPNNNNDLEENLDELMVPSLEEKRLKTQYIFVAATLPDYGLRSVDAYLQKKFPTLLKITSKSGSGGGMHNARHYGLVAPTQWIQEPIKKERMKLLVNLLQTPSPSPSDSSSTGSNTLLSNDEQTMKGLKNEKVMIFLNSVDDVENASLALNRINGIVALPYHAKVPLDDRTVTLEKFRQYQPSSSSNINIVGDNEQSESEPESDSIVVLVCTDLASRGLDIPGVTVVVQLQFATNVVAHLHRMGRCGRAGQKNGSGIIFYDTAIEGPLVQIVQEAEIQQQNNQKPKQLILGNEINANDFDRNDGTEDNDDNMTEQQQEDEDEGLGKVQKAFSRKRGFTKKLKKIKREARTSSSGTD